MAVRHSKKIRKPKGQPFQRRTKSGKVVMVKGRKVKPNQSAGTKRPQLRAGLKFNRSGAVVKDRNVKRVGNRALKQSTSLGRNRAKRRRRRR